ncbi:MAG: ATP-binding cassette domain-containing protein [Candidatus Limivicinus sp.]|jgi:energy-coupling factor transport system ATP-binding protein
MPLSIDSVSYTYASGTALAVRALSDVSLKIEDGEFVGIMGSTGSGKSTMLQIMAGLIKPDEGRVLLDGEDINEKKYDRDMLHSRVGLVFQYPEYQLFETTVERDVAFGLRRSGLSREDKAAAVRGALETVGFDFEKVRDKSPLGFSGGEKRRIAIAGVLAAKPAVLILDEPLAGLDPFGREDLLHMLRGLNEEGVSIIIVSHNADALAEYAKRVVVMQEGKIIRDGSAKEIFSDYFDLLHNGIGIPQVKETAQRLRERGVNMPGNVILYDQFIDRLKIIMWRKMK